MSATISVIHHQQKMPLVKAFMQWCFIEFLCVQIIQRVSMCPNAAATVGGLPERTAPKIPWIPWLSLVGWWYTYPSWEIWVRQWEGWHPIYEMENKSHVWNHQPDNLGEEFACFLSLLIWSTLVSKTVRWPSLGQDYTNWLQTWLGG